MHIKIKKLNESASIPNKNSEHDAGYDISSCEEVNIQPMSRQLVKTGISISIPTGYYAHVSDRSGMALKHGAHCLGKIIDPSFRGEIGVIIYNTDMYAPIKIKQGQRIAQIIFKKYENVNFIEVDDELDATERGEGGFGSSGE